MVDNFINLIDHFCESGRFYNEMKCFEHNFEIVKAYNINDANVLIKNSQLEEEAYKIRHNAYCKEHDFENSDPSSQEKDDFDQYAYMALIRHRPSDSYVGTVRMVAQGNGCRDLPTIASCEQKIPNINNKEHSYAEISRLCLSYERLRAAGVTKKESVLIMPGILKAALEISTDLGATHWVGCMEPILIKTLQRFYNVGLDWVGQEFEHHGKRQPFITDVKTLINTVHEKHTVLRDIIDYIHYDLPFNVVPNFTNQHRYALS
tara:strand:+ start:358400 stop:359185 length:786 start_codon:yes stop_codon:yes gene_type:complete